MAAVSFLETTNLVGLGLSADKVYSHITDLSGTKISTVDSSPLPTSNQASSSISLKLQQQQNTGLKLVSEVMDSSSKIFDGINKFWQRNAQELVEQHSKRSGGNGTSLIEQMKGRVGSASNSNSSKVNPKEGELKEMTLNNDSMPTISSTSSSTATKPISSSSSSSSLPAFMEERSFSRFRKSKSTATTALLSGEGPIQKFLDMKSVDELKIGEVTELLADYKRLAAMIKQAGLA
ncbi:hypothetical protein BDF20DRAFT_897908 [Mycotypha africana]|uniref:uncharacterized protein n=1 Tax=Mycotypha africana TaxID=64632 RepID=UPI0023005F4E|nr:uncharacterized protein BDF20DRAFT_897908 [Mycotypha africana]KAI8967929.1 hypothetical protein BDF20DRAFT_897908 [Mycotypha africana]